MSDRAAEGTRKSEARVEVNSLRLLLDGRGQSSSRGSHCDEDGSARRKGSELKIEAATTTKSSREDLKKPEERGKRAAGKGHFARS